MTVTRVRTGSNAGTTTALVVANGTTTGTGGVAPAAGNLLVAWADSDSTVTISAGWAAGPSVVDGNGAYMWYKVAAGTETTTTFTPTGGAYPIAAGILEYSGLTGTPFDVQGSSTIGGSSGSTTTAVSVTTAAAGDLVVAGAMLHSLGGLPSSPVWSNGFANVQTVNTGVVDATQPAVFIGELVAGAAGAVSTSVSWSGGTASDRQELVMAFKAGAAGSSFSGSVALAGAGSLAGAGKPAVSGPVALSGSGALTSAGKPSTSGGTAPAGAGTLALSGVPNAAGSLALGGSGSLTFTSGTGYTGTLALSGSGSLSLSGNATGTASGTLNTTGTGTLALSGKITANGALTLAGLGALTAAGQPATGATLALAGSGSLTLSGVPLGLATDITVTGTLDPRRWAVTLLPSTKTATLEPRRWDGSL